MRADVAGTAGRQQRVGQRMQTDIGIGMAGEFPCVRNPDPAKPDMVTCLEGVHVIAIAGADVGKARKRGGKPLSAISMSLAQVSLTLSGEPSTSLTGNPLHSASAASSVKSNLPSRCGLQMRLINRPERKALWRLGREKPVARDRCGNQSVFARAFQRVGNRDRRQRRLPFADRGDYAVDQGGIDEGPHRIVDQYLAGPSLT